MNPALKRVRRRAGRLRRQIREPVMVVLVAGVVEVGIRFWRLPRLANALGIQLRLDGAPTPPNGAIVPRWTLEALHATDAVLRRWPGGDTCLRRSLVLGQRLRRLRPVLRVGVRSGDGADQVIAAHAWLEIDGAALDPRATDYAVLSSPICRR